MLKQLLLIGCLFAVGFGGFLYFRYGINVVSNIPTMLTAIPSTIQNGVSWLMAQPVQVLASAAGAIGSVSLVVGKLFTSLRQAKQQTEEVKEMVVGTQAYATQQAEMLNKTIDTQKTVITSQTEKIQGLEQQIASNTDSTLLQNQLQDTKQELSNANSTIDELKGWIEEFKQKEKVIVR